MKAPGEPGLFLISISILADGWELLRQGLSVGWSAVRGDGGLTRIPAMLRGFGKSGSPATLFRCLKDG